MMSLRDLQVVVYNDGYKVFDGELDRFFKDNQEDEYLLDICQSLLGVNHINFYEYHSGTWKIEKKKEIKK